MDYATNWVAYDVHTNVHVNVHIPGYGCGQSYENPGCERRWIH